MASSWMESPNDKGMVLLKHQWLDRRFRCQDNNVAFTNVQPHYYRVRLVEPRHHLGWSSQALILSILALGAPSQQQQQPVLSVLTRKQIWSLVRFCVSPMGRWEIGNNVHFIKTKLNLVNGNVNYEKILKIRVGRSARGNKLTLVQAIWIFWFSAELLIAYGDKVQGHTIFFRSICVFSFN